MKILGAGLLLDKTILVYGDLHLGIEESIYTRDSAIPRTQFVKIKRIIMAALDKYKPKIVVLNGDIKHEFGKISNEEWTDVLEIMDLILEKAELIVIEGNHDKVMSPIAAKRNIKIVDKFEYKDYLITHGDTIIDSDTAKTVIIGHEHPAIELREHEKKERYKCYLKGSFNDKELIVMPSLSQLTEGTDVLTGKLLSPYLKDIKDYEVFVITHSGITAEVLSFGRIKDLD